MNEIVYVGLDIWFSMLIYKCDYLSTYFTEVGLLSSGARPMRLKMFTGSFSYFTWKMLFFSVNLFHFSKSNENYCDCVICNFSFWAGFLIYLLASMIASWI
jgi:hypothetical protein